MTPVTDGGNNRWPIRARLLNQHKIAGPHGRMLAAHQLVDPIAHGFVQGSFVMVAKNLTNQVRQSLHILGT
jgi:hypothetical protein